MKIKHRRLFRTIMIFYLLAWIIPSSNSWTTTNYFSTIASSSINAVSKYNTGTDYIVVAGTVSNICTIFIFNRTGTKVAEKQVGDSTTNLTVCNKLVQAASSGNIYITGSTKTLESDSSSTNILIGKFDPSTLASSWTVGWGGSNGNEVGLDIKVTYNEGYVYSVGYSNKFTQYSGGNNPVVAKFKASDGSNVWGSGIGGNAVGQFNSVDIPYDDSYVYWTGTTQIWTITAGYNSGVLVKISGTGTLQWVRMYSVASTNIAFNKVVVMHDHSSVWTFGNSAGTSGLIVKWSTSGTDTLILTLSSMIDIFSASLFVDQTTIFFGGQTSASKLYIGGLRISDSTLILNKYANIASSSWLDISVNDLGYVGVVGTFGSLGLIVNFDSEFNDACTDLVLTAFAGSLTASSTSVSTVQSSQTLYSIYPIMITNSITLTGSATTITNKVWGEVWGPVYIGTSIVSGSALSQSAATFAFATLSTSFTYSATLMDNSSPGGWWLSVASGGTMSGTPTSGQRTYVKIKATYTNTITYTSSALYKITVTNTSPTVSVAIPDQSSVVGTAFSFGFTTSVFSDSNSGDSLTYTSLQNSGSVLPSWLSFDWNNRLFSGTPTTAATYNIKVTATDLGGSSISDVFQLSITNTDPVASTTIPNQYAIIGTEFIYSIPSNAFSDTNGNTISYVSATQTDSSALPSWIVFVKELGMLAGVPTTVGTLSVRITATDGYGGTNPTSDFNIVITTRPSVTTYSDLIKSSGDSISISTPFTDADGDTLTYTGVLQNGSSTLTPFSLSSSGTLAATFTSSNDVKYYGVKVTATDTKSASISSTQNVIVNSPPAVSSVSNFL